ncbi:protein containing Signal transduction response regulator, C-terminal domain [sediment metagenome]|uniref:Protein containing Signal transduction response regulator, C-terminal domain n=1 Tax=sediment metagenome TaxID=749907 RepID=D9PNM1_9ZZZZ
MITYPEATYPITFRSGDAKRLGSHLKNHDSVVMIGMKRVGINNFLRFFLHHPGVPKTYIDNGTPHVFIPVDLNDLVEREIFPFWTLLLKRSVDVVERLNLPEKEKQAARKLFSESIQLKDLFLTIDSVQKVLNIIIDGNFYPTIFLIRFDRLELAFTQEFFHNLQGLKDATHRHMSYVFTSYRPLYELAPRVFTKASLAAFSQDMYLAPAATKDLLVVLNMLLTRYHITIPDPVKNILIEQSGGHVQYLHVSLLRVQEHPELIKNPDQLLLHLQTSDDVALQSEELFESLTPKEQAALRAYRQRQEPVISGTYLTDIGMITTGGTKQDIFSPLFAQYLHKIQSHKNGSASDFTKKEHVLFTFLKTHENQLCERDAIISAVWPEYEEAGVSDWAIDRLVARVRAKLKAQHSPFEIVTVITRGYKLVGK